MSYEPSLASPTLLRDRADDAHKQAKRNHDRPGISAKENEPVNRQVQHAGERQN
jgi:hypothetical protein